MDILTVAEVAAELGLSKNTVRVFCQKGRLGTKVGRQWLITREELDVFKSIPRKPGPRPKKK